MQRRQVPILLVPAVLVGLFAVGCGRDDNPVAPPAPALGPAAAEGGASSSSLGDVNTATAIQSWTIQDACSDGKGIRTRLWEAIGLRLTGRATRIFATRSSLGAVRFRLLCVKGTNSCMGATTNPASAAIWGVGLNAERRPAKAFCRACSTTAASFRLTCTQRLDGSLDAQLVEDDLGAADGVDAASAIDEGLATFEAE